jgi:ubiquinone/menaquinone biosynthesis C-methylase UbiE
LSKILQLSSIDAHALWAATYDRALNPILSLEERYVEPLLPLMTGMDVLDVACGTGRWLARLVRRGTASAVGLDVSEEMLQQARKKQPGAGSLLQSDATKMPVRSAAMDFAICSFGLSYIPDIEGCAKELSRVMRNRGDVVISDFHPSAQARGWKRSFRHNDAVIEVSSFPRSVAQIRETFEEAGLELTICLEPPFGETERPIFEKCGKATVFEQLLGEPAIVVFVFRRAT